MLENQASLFKPGILNETLLIDRIKTLEYKILAVRKDLETEQCHTSTLHYMILTRQNNIHILSEPLRCLKENLSKISTEHNEANNTLYRNQMMYKSIKDKILSLRSTMNETREDRDIQKVENLTKFSDRTILIEFIKRQKKQEEIKKIVDKNEKQLDNLEHVLKDTTESEEINKEIQACNLYIARQEQMFLKLKQMTNLSSLDMAGHYHYLNDTKRTLITNQANLEQKIENAQSELNIKHNELNSAILENLSAAVDAKSRYALRKISIIEESILEKNQALYEYKKQVNFKQIDKKENTLARICAVFSKIRNQLEPETALKDITISEVESELASITKKICELQAMNG